MTVRNPLVLIPGGNPQIQELPAGDTLGGAAAGVDGTNGTNGGAITIAYAFSTTTTDADPGNGALRLDNATQNTATHIYADLNDSSSVDWTSVLDTFDASTNTVKGSIRLVKVGDATKFLTFNVTARTTATGYRKFTVTNTGSSSASPFANNDSILLCFDRAGDAGAGASSDVEILLAYTSAATKYSLASSPTTDTTVKMNDGTTTMQLSFTLSASRTLRVKFYGRFSQASGGIRMSIYVDGSKVSPVTTLQTTGWYAAGTLATDNDHVMIIDTLLTVAAGSHTMNFQHQAAGSTNALDWGERCCSVYAVPSSPSGSV